MRIRKRSSLITLGLAAALVAPAAPAGAVSGPASLDGEINIGLGKFLDISVTLGDRRRIVLELAQEYLAARDQGWKDPAGPGAVMSGIENEGAKVAEQPRTFAAGLSTVAAEAADESALHATEVATGFVDDEKVEFSGNTATVTLTSGTMLGWNDASLGDSSLSDTYIIAMERQGRTWTITDASYAPIPSTGTPVTEPAPTVATDTAEAEAEADGEVGARARRAYDRDKAVEYALKYSEVYKSGRYGQPVSYARNPDYKDLGSTNCANFVSQALKAGNWNETGGVNPQDPDNWDYDLSGPVGAKSTMTWVNANWLFEFAAKHRGTEQNFWPPAGGGQPGPGDPDFAVWELQPGDLLFADWDTKIPDGVQDHAMIVTGTYTSQGFTEPTYSQNSPNRHNLPLSIGMKMAYASKYVEEGIQPIYTPVKLDDPFED